MKKSLEALQLAAPKTLSEFVEAMSKPHEIGDEPYAFQPDLLSRFAFHHIEGNQVAVRLGLSNGPMIERGHLTQIGLLLPMPLSLREAFQKADAKKEGFLMKDDRFQKSIFDILFGGDDFGGSKLKGLTTEFTCPPRSCRQ